MKIIILTVIILGFLTPATTIAHLREVTPPRPGTLAKPTDFVITPPWADDVEHNILAGYGIEGGSSKHWNFDQAGFAKDYYALDFDLALDEAVYPIAPGKVIFAGTATVGWSGFGNIVYIDHENGYSSLYAHLNSVEVSMNQSVNTATKLGGAGRSGTPEVHLHLALYKDAHFQEDKNKGTGPYSGQAVVPEPFAQCTKADSLNCENLQKGDRLKKSGGASTPPPATELITALTIDYFALGDSIASGHGLSDKGGACRRSGFAYPYYVVRDLRKQFPTVNFPTSHHIACSGATARPNDETLKQDSNKSLHSQVEYILEQIHSDHPTLVTITIGANDFGWSNPSNILDLFDKKDSDYYTWVDQKVADIQVAVRDEIKRLLDRPNVAVVITDYYNPFNTKTIFATAGLLQRRNIDCAFGTCYQRIRYAVAALNLALTTIWKGLGGPERLRIAGIDQAFQGHESPSRLCGLDAPEAKDSWIQYPDDPDSNSSPPDVPGALELLNGGPWRGDCFHPREPGALAIAKAVSDNAVRVLPAILRGTLDSYLLDLPDLPILQPGVQQDIQINIQNTGQMQWSSEDHFTLVNTNNQPLGLSPTLRPGKSIPAGGIAKLTLTITAPPKPSPYESIWQMAYNGLPFGDRIRILVVVVPKGSSGDFSQMIQAMIDDARQQINAKFEAAWEELQREIERRIQQEIERQVQRQLQALCGVAPTALVVAGGMVWWRRRRSGRYL